MCRILPHLSTALEQTNTTNVYEVDEQMADLALQMTRIGLPVNSERRAEIGARLRALRDAADRDRCGPTPRASSATTSSTGWPDFFAAKARKGEPTDGAIRIGPTRAAVEHEAARAALAEWRAYRKQVIADGLADAIYMDSGDGTSTTLLADTDKQIAAFADQVKLAKQQVKIAQFDADENDGLAHTAEICLRRFARQFVGPRPILAIEKKGVNFGAKVQQCAILRAAGVPLLRKTEKTGLPKIDKEVLEGLARHQAAKALLSYILTEKTINVYIEGEKRAGKGGGKSRPVMVTEDGYIHPLWKVHQITGRWSSSAQCQQLVRARRRRRREPPCHD